jgi:hypothetical protein
MLRRILLIVVASLSGCGDDKSTPPQPNEYVDDCDQGVDAGAAFASDENYAAFLDKEAAHAVTTNNCKAPQITSPQAGSTLDRTTPPLIAFNDTPASCRLAHPAAVLMAQACKLRKTPLWKRLLRAFVLEGVAEAHCGAFTGTNYLLRLSHAGDTKPVYMSELSVTSYTPDAAIWQQALTGHGGQTLTLTIERAVFFRGDIMEGPYISDHPLTLQVAP